MLFRLSGVWVGWRENIDLIIGWLVGGDGLRDEWQLGSAEKEEGELPGVE